MNRSVKQPNVLFIVAVSRDDGADVNCCGQQKKNGCVLVVCTLECDSFFDSNAEGYKH